MKLVLVVDDDESLRRMVARLLAADGYESVAVETTEDALKTLAGGRVDAVLLDCVLGQENGWEALRRIRELCPVPVVMMSGATMDGDARADALTMGAQAVLQKPFERHELLACLAALDAPPAQS
jgi:two-component system response regulator MprA